MLRGVRKLVRDLRSLGPELERRDAELRALIESNHSTVLEAVRLVADEEHENRRRLGSLRASESYAAPFDLPEPLVSIPIPTYDNAAGIAERSVPSALAQTYENIEVVVVGDGSPSEVEEAARGFDDPRVRFVNLERRGPYPLDKTSRWYVAGTMPLNEALRLARGHWMAILNDDDVFRPNHVEELVKLAREQRAEVAYGGLLMHKPDGSTERLGTFPPHVAGFGWQMGMFHEGLRFFGYSLGAEIFREPGDWHLCRRMLRSGVRFAMTEEILIDYYPAILWDAPD